MESFIIPHSDSIPRDSLCPWIQREWFHRSPGTKFTKMSEAKITIRLFSLILTQKHTHYDDLSALHYNSEAKHLFAPRSKPANHQRTQNSAPHRQLFSNQCNDQISQSVGSFLFMCFFFCYLPLVTLTTQQGKRQKLLPHHTHTYSHTFSPVNTSHSIQREGREHSTKVNSNFGCFFTFVRLLKG